MSSANQPSRVIVEVASSIQPRPIDWLWEGWLACGKLHILAGAPGTGKTTIAMNLASTVTRGGRWPDGTESEPGDVLIWTGEDDPTDVLVPRLIAAGADRSRIHFVQGLRDAGELRDFDPARDMSELCSFAKGIESLRLIILDPIVNAVSGDSHRNNEVRRALAPVVRMAESVRAVVLGISHFSKGSSGRDPAERVNGSVAFSALARVVLVTTKINESDGDDSRLLARAKSNLGVDGGGFAYSLEQVPILLGRLEASRVTWGRPVEGSARELLAEAELSNDDTRDDRKDAAEWLTEALRAAPLPERAIRKLAEEQGFKWHTVKRSKRRAGVVSDREGFGKGGHYCWRLAEQSSVLHGEHGVQPKSVVLHVPHGANGRLMS